MTTKITLAKVTHINRWLKVSYIKLNKNIELMTNIGSIFDTQLKAGEDTWYWFAFDDAVNRIVDMSIATEGGDLVLALTAKHKNLVNATKAITDTYTQLDVSQLNAVLQQVGTLLAAGTTGLFAWQAIQALLIWEPITLGLSLVGTAAAGLFTTMQYERLTHTEKAAITASVQFQAALTDFHTIVKAYAPVHMSEYAVASPAFNGIHTKLYKWLPRMSVSSMETNRPNWSVA